MKTTNGGTAGVRRRVQSAIDQLRSGGLILLADSEERENEVDLACSARHITAAQVSLLLKRASGLLCLAVDSRKASALGLSLLPHNHRDRFDTPFAQPITYFRMEHSAVSLEGRARTIVEASKEIASSRDFCVPGHVATLIARDGGVRERHGQTEGIVDLLRLAGEPPVGVLCEMIGPSGGMVPRAGVREFIGAELPFLTIDELIAYRAAHS